MVRPFRRAAPLALALAMTGSAAADDPKPGRTLKPPPPPEDLFGLGEDTERPATCADATALPCPIDPARARDTAPAARATRLRAERLARLPLADADLDVAATLVTGAGRDDQGAYFAGATGVENRWLLDGAPIESVRTGALTTRIPLGFLDEVVVTTGGFSARDPAVAGALIDARLREGGARTRASAAAWLGAGLTPRTTERVRGEYRPFEGRFDDLRTTSAIATIDGPLTELGGARLWWAAGIAPRLDDRSLVRHAHRLVDDDDDGVPDRDADGRVSHGRIGTIDRDALGWSVPILARAGARGARQELALTVLAISARDLRWATTAEATAAGVDRDLTGGDLIATWRGRWGATGARVQGSWHREAREEDAHAGADLPSIGYAYLPLPADGLDAGDARVRAECLDGGAGDAAPMLVNCPLETGYYLTGGVGRTIDTIADRPRLTAELSRDAGEHALSAGVSGEDARMVVRERFSGGRLRHHLGELAFLDYRMISLDAGPDTCGAGIPCTWLDTHERTLRTRHVAAWLADTWRPAPAIAVEYGVRGESSQIGESVVVRDVLPRIGAGWDFLGQGRSRLSAGWGRYAALLPAGAGERIFGGPPIYQEITFGDQVTTSVVAPGDVPVFGKPRGVRVDEALAGLELGVADVARLELGARHRHLGRTLEDDDGRLTTGGHLTGARADRDLTELHATFENSPAAVVHVRTGYAWSRLRGNWPGPWDPYEGLTLYGSTLFATTPTNRTGPLPGDQPHRFFAEIAGRGRAWGFDVDASVRAVAASGRPRSVRALGATQAFLLPRGAGGRLPTVAQANVHLAARRGALTVALDVFNLFDRRGATAVDEVYTPDETTPIDGGAAEDLVFLKDTLFEGATPRINRRFGEPNRFQAPAAAYLSLRVDL